MIDLFVGVDGTGPHDDAQYTADFSNSCVHEWCLIWGKFNDNVGSDKESRYIRGPTTLDIARYTGDLARQVVAHVVFYDKKTKQEKRALNIHLAGYSRGGAAVILACNELKKSGVKIETLMLYDAVDRSRVEGVDLVPDNVRYAIHAMRHPDTESRPEFGNCGTGVQDDRKTMLFVNRGFRCTHGGMGGVPWVPQEEPPRSAFEAAAPWVMGGLMGGVIAETQKHRLQNHRDKGLIVEPRPGVLPDGRAQVSYDVDQAESQRVRFWMKLQWKLRRTLTSRVVMD